MATEFTPGPWSHNPNDDWRHICSDNHFGHRHVIAQVERSLDGESADFANALLIAAAPALFAELEAAYEIMDAQLCGDFPEVLERIRRVLAEATGERVSA